MCYIKYENGIFKPTGERPRMDALHEEFDFMVLSEEDNQNICHIVSVACIIQGVCNALNVMKCNGCDLYEGLLGMIGSVYGIELDNILDDLNVNEGVDFAYVIEYICNGILDCDYDTVLIYVNHLVEILSNARKNARPGNSNWNKSVGLAFDPVGQCVCGNMILIDDGAEGVRLNNLLNHTYGETNGVLGTEDALHYYMATRSENIIFVYSSNLDEEFEKVDNFEKVEDDVRLLYYYKEEFHDAYNGEVVDDSEEIKKSDVFRDFINK